jgi:hypothetical protein
MLNFHCNVQNMVHIYHDKSGTNHDTIICYFAWLCPQDTYKLHSVYYLYKVASIIYRNCSNSTIDRDSRRGERETKTEMEMTKRGRQQREGEWDNSERESEMTVRGRVRRQWEGDRGIDGREREIAKRGFVISHTFVLLIRSSGCQIWSDPIHRSVLDPSR